MFGESSPTYKMKTLPAYAYEMGPFRPPSEGRSGSLLIRTTRHCSWNRCQFCISRDEARPKFEYRPVADIKRDIDTVKALADELKAASVALGAGGEITQPVVNAIVQGNQGVYGVGAVPPPGLQERWMCLVSVANWLNSGQRTVFLQDSNSIIMRTPDLLEVLHYLKANFPTIERVTTYGRAKNCAKKSLAELIALREAGLTRIHVGFESGCDEVLAFVDKGVTAEEQVLGGRRVVEAGIALSEYFMPGLGGKKWSRKHVLDSARALSAINPEFIRFRTLALRYDSPLWERYERGEFTPLTEDEMVDEIGLLIENLGGTPLIESDHVWNLLMEVEGKLPADRGKMLDIIRNYQCKPLFEKLSFNLDERLRYWGFPGDLATKQLVNQAREAIQRRASDAGAIVEKATLAIKQHGG